MAQGGASILIPLYVALVLLGDPAEFGLVAGLGSFFGVAASFLWGRWSDKIGRRKPFVILSFLGVSIGMILIAFTDSLTALIAANILQIFLWLASVSVSTPLVIEDYEKGTWTHRIGRFNRFSMFGWTAGLLLGAIWMGFFGEGDGAKAAIRALFYILGALALTGTILAAFWIKEPEINLERRQYQNVTIAAGSLWERFRYAPARLFHLVKPQRVLETFRGKNVFGAPLTRYYYAIVVYHLGFQAFFVPLPLFVKDGLGLSSAAVFALFIFHQAAAALTNPYVAQFAKRHRTRYLQRIFLAIRMVVVLITSSLLLIQDYIIATHIILAILLAVSGLSWAFIDVSAISVISKRVRIGVRSQAIGTYHSSIGFGNIFGAFIGGALASFFGYPIAFLFSAICVTIGLLMTRRLPKRRTQSGITPEPTAEILDITEENNS